MGTVIQLNVREVLILIAAFVSLVFGFGRLLVSQFEKRMNERFDAMHKLRKEERATHTARVQAVEDAMEAASERLGEVVKRVEKLHQNLPLEYVRREDWIRFASTIDAKLDRLADAINYLHNGSANRERH